jgi:tetratricopeptide (TPR) repeat protein
MKHRFISILFFIIVFSMYGQQQVIDSLEQQLIDSTNGLSKVEILNELGWYYAYYNPDKGIEKANKAIKSAISIGDSLQLGIAYERKGFNHQSKGEDSLTIALFKKAKKVYTLINHQRRLVALTFNTGNFYFYRSNYDKSLEYMHEALKYYKSEKDSVKMSRAYNIIGLNHLYLGDYTLSVEVFQKGLLLLELTLNQDTQFYAELLGNLALLYEKVSDFEKALKYQKKALTIHSKNGYRVGISNAYINIGKLYSKLGTPKKALDMFIKSLKIKEQLGNKYRLANGLTNLGITYSELNQYTKAVENLEKAKSIYHELGHDTNLSVIYKNLGDIFLDKRKLKQAKVQYDSSYVYAKKAEDKRALYIAKEGLSEIAFQNKNYKKAYIEQLEATIIKDSMLSNEKRDEYAKLKAKYEYEKEKAVLEATFEKSKALDKAKIQQQTFIRNVSIGGGILGIAILATVLTQFRRRKEAQLNEKIATSELQAIRAQLNPHFIFNSLNSINDYVINNEKDAASNYLVRFSMMMRKILNNSKEEEVPLEEEIAFLDNYIQLEQQRLSHKFSYSIEVANTINKANTLVPPTLFQPFIENSIWHGLSEKKENGRLTITFQKEQHTLVCIIDDNGVGIEPKKDSNKKSFGTGSAQNRIALLNKLKGGDAQIDFKEKEQGIQVILRLPLSIEA